jgi:hypothetical protein
VKKTEVTEVPDLFNTQGPPNCIPAISAGPFQATPIGLEIRGTAIIPFELWSEYGRGLQRVEGAVNWVLGDWLNFGEARYGETYAQAMALWPETKYQQLADLKWVASHVDISIRHENLSWSHHQAVAKLSPEEQEEWLNKAEHNMWSVRDFKANLKEDMFPQADRDDPDVIRCPYCGRTFMPDGSERPDDDNLLEQDVEEGRGR